MSSLAAWLVAPGAGVIETGPRLKRPRTGEEVQGGQRKKPTNKQPFYGRIAGHGRRRTWSGSS
jgi:hypothetical protein